MITLSRDKVLSAWWEIREQANRGQREHDGHTDATECQVCEIMRQVTDSGLRDVMIDVGARTLPQSDVAAFGVAMFYLGIKVAEKQYGTASLEKLFEGTGELI